MGRRVTSKSRFARDARRFRDGDHRGAPQDARQLTAILPNGRTIWLQVDRPLAPAASLDHVAVLTERAVERRQAEIAAQAAASRRLSALIETGAEQRERERLARARVVRRPLGSRGH